MTDNTVFPLTDSEGFVSTAGWRRRSLPKDGYWRVAEEGKQIFVALLTGNSFKQQCGNSYLVQDKVSTSVNVCG